MKRSLVREPGARVVKAALVLGNARKVAGCYPWRCKLPEFVQRSPNLGVALQSSVLPRQGLRLMLGLYYRVPRLRGTAALQVNVVATPPAPEASNFVAQLSSLGNLCSRIFIV